MKRMRLMILAAAFATPVFTGASVYAGEIDGNAVIEVDGKRSEVVAVLVGSEVILRTTADRSSVRAISATSPEADDDSE